VVGAQFVTLPNVGHVPMFDDPQLVADTILSVTAAASSRVVTNEQRSPST
jgi:pimeloyl-ACP methyl ester carboxylesterase